MLIQTMIINSNFKKNIYGIQKKQILIQKLSQVKLMSFSKNKYFPNFMLNYQNNNLTKKI